MEEVDARQRGRHRAPLLVHVVGLARHVGVVAQQHQRLRARRQIAQGQVRIEILRKTGVGLGIGRAEGALDGNLLPREDPWPGIRFADGVQAPSDLPGLGVSRAATSEGQSLLQE